MLYSTIKLDKYRSPLFCCTERTRTQRCVLRIEILLSGFVNRRPFGNCNENFVVYKFNVIVQHFISTFQYNLPKHLVQRFSPTSLVSGAKFSRSSSKSAPWKGRRMPSEVSDDVCAVSESNKQALTPANHGLYLVHILIEMRKL